MSYYSERLATYGPDVRALGWGSEESQLIRFKVLSQIADLHGMVVLDFGCGFGDLYAYLGKSVNYIGCDENPDMLEQARAKYPHARFIDHPVEADYILESGAFNLLSSWEFVVTSLWEFCRCGMALNFTSTLAEVKNPDIFYSDPADVVEVCTRLSKRFMLRHDYKENDFCVYCYR